MKKIVVLLVCLLGLFALSAQAADSTVHVTMDGVAIPFDSTYGVPFIDGAGRTQVPLRLTMERFGASVSWDASTRTATVQKDGITVKVPIGQSYIYVNGVKTANDTAACIVDGRTYLPIRAVLEAFGAKVTWDGSTRTVAVTTGGAAQGETVQVHFIDVGQGDAALIDCGTVEVLIDGGDNSAGPGLVSYLRPFIDGKLDYLIATHPDADHVGGLDDVIGAFEVGEIIDSGFSADTANYRRYITAAQSEPGCTFSYDEDRIIPLADNTILTIIETGDSWTTSNDSSVIAQLNCGGVSVLFAGDMSQDVERKCLSLFGDVDVLKVGHHGSKTSSCGEFLSVVRPEYAVISYGEGNSYHHPTKTTLSRLLSCGATVFGTGKSGTILLTTDGRTYQFNTNSPLSLENAG